MASFKVCIADPKTSKTYQKEVKDDGASALMGLNIGEAVKGEALGLEGYELVVTGGSDFCGFPMRRGIMGVRKKISAYGGVGFPGMKHGMRKRKTVCGHKINEKISQVNLKVTKAGTKKLETLVPAGAKEEGGDKEAKKDTKEAKEAPKEDKGAKEDKAAAKEEKAEAPKEDKKAEAVEEKKEESKEAAAPKEDKKAEASTDKKDAGKA